MDLGGVEFRETPDQLYATHDGKELRADIFAPVGGEPAPVVIGFPGGAFRQCNRKALRQWGRLFASYGYGFIAAQYRVDETPEPTFPQAVRDGVAAVRFARAVADPYRFDPSRVGVFGTSAGANIAANVALGAEEPLFLQGDFVEKNPDDAGGVIACIGVYGVYDFLALWRQSIAENEPPGAGVCRTYLGAELPENPQPYIQASPIFRATYDAARDKSFFLAWGTHDLVVQPQHQSEAFARALVHARANVLTCPVIGAGHFWANSEPHDEPGSASNYLAPRLMRFVRSALAKK